MDKLLEYCKTNKFFNTIKNLDEYIASIIEVYEDEDLILKEFKKMNNWILANPEREKKKYSRFIYNWMSREGTKIQSQQYIKNLTRHIGK